MLFPNWCLDWKYMKKSQKTIVFWILMFLVMAFAVKVFEEGNQLRKKITYKEFHRAVLDGRVAEVTFKGKERISGRFVGDYENGISFELTGSTGDRTADFLESKGIIANYEPEEGQSFLATIFINWFPMILIFLIFYFFIRQIQVGGGKALNFGKSRAKMLNDKNKKVTFDDVAGIDEAKEELWEVVDFLKNSKRYTTLGGKIPKGVLLVGPPGTGKTLLARAVAGEADVPFFSISGSDFVEMFVGVGASRVRDLFEQGKKHAPCIIFIDEIDAVGRHRGAGLGGGHDEREQTLNQLLVEMDGFEANTGVILIAATNRIDVLDPALLRPGRFDRRITVDRPDVKGRLGVLKVHTQKTPIAENIDLEVIARGTPGFTGADLANLVNEAALIAARARKKKIEIIDFEEAKDKVIMGSARRSLVLSEKQKRITAYHEAGHAIVGLNLPETDPVHKVTIMPRGQALGVTQTLPNEDMYNMNSERLHNFIAFLMGGRCAEEIIFGERTNGASNDIERATDIARNMVCHWGMSKEMGPVNYGSSRTQPFVGMQDAGKEFSEETARRIDLEVVKIVDRNYQMAMDILRENKEELIDLSEKLIEWETLEREQILAVLSGEDIGKPKFEKRESLEEKIKKDRQKAKELAAAQAKKKKEVPQGGGLAPA